MNVSTAITTPVPVETLAKAFEAWENGFRADPGNFLSADECAALGVSEISANRASYFAQLLSSRLEG